MSDAILNDILKEIKSLNKRMDRIEWLLIDSKIEEVEPTPEEVNIISEYEKEKSKGNIVFKSFNQVNLLDLLISPKAEKQLLSLPKDIQENIRRNLNILLDEGLRSSIDIKKLAGYSNHYRIRIGEYRVRMEFEKPDKLKIYWIGKRSKAYSD